MQVKAAAAYPPAYRSPLTVPLITVPPLAVPPLAVRAYCPRLLSAPTVLRPIGGSSRHRAQRNNAVPATGWSTYGASCSCYCVRRARCPGARASRHWGARPRPGACRSAGGRRQPDRLQGLQRRWQQRPCQAPDTARVRGGGPGEGGGRRCRGAGRPATPGRRGHCVPRAGWRTPPSSWPGLRAFYRSRPRSPPNRRAA